MNTEFFEALALLEKEKGIPADYLLEKIKAAIAIAVKRDYGGSENGQVEIDPEKGKFQVAIRKTVVEAVENPNTEILLNDAYQYDKKAEIDPLQCVGCDVCQQICPKNAIGKVEK